MDCHRNPATWVVGSNAVEVITSGTTGTPAIEALTSMLSIAHHQLLRVSRYPKVTVAQTAIYSSYNAGPEVDVALTSIINDPNANEAMKSTAASQLRTRGADLDDATEQKVTAIVGASYGGAGYGGGYYRGEYMDH